MSKNILKNRRGVFNISIETIIWIVVLIIALGGITYVLAKRFFNLG